MRYKVNWIQYSIDQSKTVVIGFLVVISIMFLFKYLKNGEISNFKSLGEALKSMVMWSMFLVGTVFSVGFIFIRTMDIEIMGNKLSGKNFWSFKNVIQISDIYRMYNFQNAAGQVLIVDAGSQGKVCISPYTENFDDIVLHIETNSKVKNA